MLTLPDLDDDPAETSDVASRYPDIVAAIQASVNAALPAFPASVQTAWNNTMNISPCYCTPGGWPSAPGQ